MTFSQLHERLRVEMWRRVQRGVVTGKLLAAQTGLKPSHISNFLHRKRKLSLAALDRLLAAQQLTVQELAESMTSVASSRPAGDPMEDSIPIVSQTAAMNSPNILRRVVQGYITLPAGELDRFPPRRTNERRVWRRFVAVRVSSEQARAMEPVLRELSLAIIDRHYNSFVPVDPAHPNLYAIRLGSRMVFRYAHFEANRLVLRPHALEFPVEAVELPSYEFPTSSLVGRVCLCVTET